MAGRDDRLDRFDEGFRFGETKATLEGLARSIDLLRHGQAQGRREAAEELKNALAGFKASLPCRAHRVRTIYLITLVCGAWAALCGLFYAFLEHVKK